MELLNDSAAPQRKSPVLKSKIFLLWALLVSVGVILICANPFSARHAPFGDDDQDEKAIFPRKIWQV